MSNCLHRAFLVHLVYLVCLVCLVEQDQPDESNQPDKQNKPDEPDRPSGIISATRKQVKLATNRLLEPLGRVVCSILFSEETRAQIVQICRSRGGSHSTIPGIEWRQPHGIPSILARPDSCIVARRLRYHEREGAQTLPSSTEAL
jgi:hypothetical protein